ncbi:Na+/H+ antiporter NhaC family protein [Paraferrimonas sp. SM1919]|uniref:Na+/H+ antiporter NhaC family protein n=1 Tax=Paraferrimonas sp. SM1919 TaxID=2662263 RepID=UPI0013D21EA0|nr:Na+/H+ antiporter NhaC family protein [Paraferrimonas sp. SM1919]
MSANSSATPKASVIALLPLLTFLLFFIGAGLYFQFQGVEYAFYELPSAVATIPAIILAVILSKEKLNDAINTFIKGMGNSNIIAMCIIYLLAGAFASVAKATGGVDNTVAMGLSLIPSDFLLPGFFIISAFIATSMGTSMGTIAAVAPIALGVSQQAGIEPGLMAGAMLSGAMFGDNLSIISDTTIASTRTQGARMTDKFRENLIYAIPAALVTLLLYWHSGGGSVPMLPEEYNFFSVIPYLSILILAVAGLNVFAVLVIGIIMAGLSGIIQHQYSMMAMVNDIIVGFESMQDIFLLSLLVGGLAAMMQQQGGLEFIRQKVENLMAKMASQAGKTSARSAELGIAGIVSVSNFCVANNTVAIIVSSQLARDLAVKHDIAPRRSASILDIFACVVQGLLPYGAQALLLASTFTITPVEAISQGWYTMILALIAVMVILKRNR